MPYGVICIPIPTFISRLILIGISMITSLDGISLQPVDLPGSTSLYELHIPKLRSRYYLLSGPGSRELEAFPKVVGFHCYTALLDEMVDSLSYLSSIGLGEDLDLFTILRGGLNYPLEEAASRCGMKVREINFVSCERVIEDHVIKGLEIKYDKIRPSRGCVLAIGDILATGHRRHPCHRRYFQVLLRTSSQPVPPGWRQHPPGRILHYRRHQGIQPHRIDVRTAF